ncbi:hypothetical protein PoB_007274000 [Plakobranchus ocellatus]|uniref:Fibronectin type-III domain-containing protein n=1 Tax=Plakobranchus ocellatus TaxID=259542 RepID=A0AAV4DQL5_9GAST|nr:hypothetical protein PoB_007274000 [Plakobranchus ocellatus]
MTSDLSHVSVITIACSTTTGLVWVDIDLPFVARYLKIKFQTWEGDAPASSMELIGYRYTPDLWGLKYESLRWINAQAVLTSIVSSNLSSMTVGTTFNVMCTPGYTSDQRGGTFTTFCTNHHV